VHLPKGIVLYEAGDPIHSIYFPHNAVVGLINIMEDGQAAEVTSFGREGLCGLLSALKSRHAFGRYKVQVPGTASSIALSKIHEAIRTRPKLQELILSYNEALLAQTFQTVSCTAVHSAEARCCNWILSTRDRIDDDILPLTHADWAELMGVQRSTVSIVLRSLQTTGLITQHRGGSALWTVRASKRWPVSVTARSDEASCACCPSHHPGPNLCDGCTNLALSLKPQSSWPWQLPQKAFPCLSRSRPWPVRPQSPAGCTAR
jgi:CRP-like cAMP-binding protein